MFNFEQIYLSPVDYTILKCSAEHLSILQEISISTFIDTYIHLNPPGIVQQYTETHFTNERLIDELRKPSIDYYLLFFQTRAAAYLRLNQSPDQSDINDVDSLEIERIYVKKEFQKYGLGKKLIEFAIQRATELHKNYIWLGVWEKNNSAIQFYNKMGFQYSHSHDFWMDNDKQVDFVLKKYLK